MNSKYEDTIKKNGEDRTERNIKSSAVSIETMNFDAAQSETDAVQRAALSALAIEGAAGRGVSHMDEVDFRRRPLRRRGEVFDVVDEYIRMAAQLKELGL